MECEYLLRIELSNIDTLKWSFSVNIDEYGLIFNETVPLKICDGLMQELSNILKWDLTVEEAKDFFKKFKGIINYRERFNNDVIANFINECYFNFLKYKNDKIVYREKAQYELYDQYNYD